MYPRLRFDSCMARPVDREVIGIETVARHVPGRSTHTTQDHTGEAEGVSRKQRPSLRCVFPGRNGVNS